MSPPLLVSCILPTRNRPGFVVEAVSGFLAQDYASRELVVVDDGDQPIESLLPRDDRIRYFYLRGRRSIGEKRNFACEKACGGIIAHVDDDDWYPPHRLSRQVRALLEAGASICGTSRVYYLDLVGARAWLYSCPGAGWVAGPSLVYLRAYWHAHRFPSVAVGEDWSFLRSAGHPGTVLDLDDPEICVLTMHHRNSCPKRPDAHWREIDSGPVRSRLGSRVDAYEAAAEGAR